MPTPTQFTNLKRHRTVNTFPRSRRASTTTTTTTRTTLSGSARTNTPMCITPTRTPMSPSISTASKTTTTRINTATFLSTSSGQATPRDLSGRLTTRHTLRPPHIRGSSRRKQKTLVQKALRIPICDTIMVIEKDAAKGVWVDWLCFMSLCVCVTLILSPVHTYFN